MSEALLELRGVSKRFERRLTLGERIANAFGADYDDRIVRAVTDVDLTIAPGEVVGLVGESGCGKSTLGRIAAGIYLPSAGTARYRGSAVAENDRGKPRKTTPRVQMIFQDPFASLDPRMRVADIIAEGPIHHGLLARVDATKFVRDLLEKVGLDGDFAPRFPHQFSGGQRQRIAIARALAMSPELIICDEPVASLDVSIQAQVLNLFMELRGELGLAYLFISHDLGVVRHVSQRVAIMYLGRIVEQAPTTELFARAEHPYTAALLAAVPRLDAGAGEFRPIAGEIPSPLAPPPGCHFHPRCPHAEERCRRHVPALRALGAERAAACHLAPLS
jgi:peptide/nickel transport system ATP-binding protein